MRRYISFALSAIAALTVTPTAAIAAAADEQHSESGEVHWEVDFFDDFDSFNPDNWQDQIIWVNDEDQCYVRNGAHGTREISKGTLKLRVVDLGEPQPCDNVYKDGSAHPDTQYVSSRIASKNRQEFVQGKWTARLRVKNNGQPGMFPAWWLLGAYNNEPPVEEADENVCWPLIGSGELDIFEHHGAGGPDHYAARAIENLGYCDGGDWQGAMLVQETTIDDFHEYSVEWVGSDIIFGLDGSEVYRLVDWKERFPEPLFAILNFAKIDASPMTETWEMEVDWVKHERLRKS
jgi:beta-glucanase (GH16 family)